MAWLFPENVHWWNYVLLIPSLLQTFVFLPLWHRTPYGLAAMRTKIVYAWAHLFAFRDRVVGRPLSWSPTGGPGGLSSRRIHLVKTLIVAWPLTTVALVVSGSAVHMDSVLDLDRWPPLAASVVYTLAAVLVSAAIGRDDAYGQAGSGRTARSCAEPFGASTRAVDDVVRSPGLGDASVGSNVWVAQAR